MNKCIKQIQVTLEAMTTGNHDFLYKFFQAIAKILKIQKICILDLS